MWEHKEPAIPFEKRVWLSTPTMHGEEQFYVNEAFRTNWVTTAGENIEQLEKSCAGLIGRRYAVGLSCGTAALHLAIRLCGEKLYGKKPAGEGTLAGKKVFCSDLTFDATVNPVAYEGGEAVFIDTDLATWNLDPAALERAFALYPEVRLVVLANLYGLTGDLNRIAAICRAHGALLVEDAAESFGACFNGVQTGAFGDLSVISFNGNKIITGSAGGMLFTDDPADAARIRKWSTQSREPAAWYQHEDLGYNYRMSNVVAGVARGNLQYLSAHIEKKKEIFCRYREGFRYLPLRMMPVPEGCTPNYWLSCATVDPGAMCSQKREELQASYEPAHGKTCPAEILEALAAYNAEGRPLWKPMHLQPLYRGHPFVPREPADPASAADVGADLFARGLCLPSDIKMTPREQEKVIDIIRRCFA